MVLDLLSFDRRENVSFPLLITLFTTAATVAIFRRRLGAGLVVMDLEIRPVSMGLCIKDMDQK